MLCFLKRVNGAPQKHENFARLDQQREVNEGEPAQIESAWKQ